LRIEDTDVERSTQRSVDAIFEAMEWLGLDWDEGPYFQSQRQEIYQHHLDKLVAAGHAYYCTCTPEAIQQMRDKAMATGAKPRYDGTCRDKMLENAPGAVVRFKAPPLGSTVLEDVVKGAIVFQNDELDDFVLCRSDGMPTYNFAVVIDDLTLGINTIIRGDDHVMNTPKQMLIYEALGATLPVYAHVPMVLGTDKTRLSKRHGAVSVTAYRDLGFLPDAFINYLARLGWSHGDQEFFTRDELIAKFNLENIGKSAGVFDPEKLRALNADHIMAASPTTLFPYLHPFLARKGHDCENGPFIQQVIASLAPRAKTLVEMAETADFYFGDTVVYEDKAARKFLKPGILDVFDLLVQELDALALFDEEQLESVFRKVMKATGMKLGKIAQPVRVALTGRTASPGIFEVIETIGKTRVILRLKAAREYIQQKQS
jgi:glutamyl-tRNA synthetase